MGLAINVGFLDDMKHNDAEGYEWARQMFATVNEFLAAEGVDGWEEPEEIGDLGMRPHISSFPYSYLHYLRRAYAYATEYPDDEVQPTGEAGLTERDDFVVGDASSMMISHLLCHSDCEGLYVPVDFPDPLFDLDNVGVPGEMLGSSFALLAELRVVAPKIGIELVDGALTDAEAGRLYEAGRDDTSPWSIEYIVFLTLWEAATASIRHRSAIVFG